MSGVRCQVSGLEIGVQFFYIKTMKIFPLGSYSICTSISKEQCLESIKNLQVNNRLRGKTKLNCFTLIPNYWRFDNPDPIAHGRIYSDNCTTYLELNFAVYKRSICAIVTIFSLMFILCSLAVFPEVIINKNFRFLIGFPIFFIPIWGVIYLRLYIEKVKILNLITQCVKSNKIIKC